MVWLQLPVFMLLERRPLVCGVSLLERACQCDVCELPDTIALLHTREAHGWPPPNLCGKIKIVCVAFFVAVVERSDLKHCTVTGDALATQRKV